MGTLKGRRKCRPFLFPDQLAALGNTSRNRTSFCLRFFIAQKAYVRSSSTMAAADEKRHPRRSAQFCSGMVDGTGIEPVAPAMSRRCSTAELTVHPRGPQGTALTKDSSLGRGGCLSSWTGLGKTIISLNMQAWPAGGHFILLCPPDIA